MNKFLRNVAALLGLLLSSTAGWTGEFVSIYRYSSLTIGTPATGNSPESTVTLTTFRDAYKPSGPSGCLMGLSEFKSLCTQPGNGLQFEFPGYTFPDNVKEVKLYIPQGTTRFTLVASMPKYTTAAVAMRIDGPPTRIAPVSIVRPLPINGIDQPTEYELIQSSMSDETAFKELLTGNDLIRVHDGGGTFTMVWGNTNAFGMPRKETTQGHWLYLRFINPTPLYQLNGSTSVNLDTYKSAYASLSFDTFGDPVTAPSSDQFWLSPTSLTQGSNVTVSQIVAGSSINLSTCQAIGVNAGYVNVSSVGVVTLNPGAQPVSSSAGVSVDIQCGAVVQTLQVRPNPNPPATPLSSITLSQYSLLSNDTATPVTVIPNSGATLGSCKAMHPAVDLLSALESPYVVFDGNTFKLNEKAAVNVTTSSRELIITCGTASSSTFTIVAPLKIDDSFETDGSLTLTVQFKPVQVPTTVSPTRIWTILFVPGQKFCTAVNMCVLKSDQYYFMPKTGGLSVLDLSTYLPPLDPFMLEMIPSLQTQQNVVIKTGFKISDLVVYKAEVHFFYQIGNGNLQYLGKVYPH